jgi:hypothetical protein
MEADGIAHPAILVRDNLIAELRAFLFRRHNKLSA